MGILSCTPLRYGAVYQIIIVTHNPNVAVLGDADPDLKEVLGDFPVRCKRHIIIDIMHKPTPTWGYVLRR